MNSSFIDDYIVSVIMMIMVRLGFKLLKGIHFHMETYEEEWVNPQNY